MRAEFSAEEAIITRIVSQDKLREASLALDEAAMGRSRQHDVVKSNGSRARRNGTEGRNRENASQSRREGNRRSEPPRRPSGTCGSTSPGRRRNRSPPFAISKTLCEEHLAGRYHIEVIDLMKNPQLAQGDQILAVPTVVRNLPAPIRKIIGTLSNTERVLVGLDLRPRDADPFAPRKGGADMFRAARGQPPVLRSASARRCRAERSRMSDVLPRTQQDYVLQLYVAGSTPQSSRAITNLKAICEAHLKDRYDLTVIDLYLHKELAKDDQIVVAPMLVRLAPLPVRRVVGDLSQTARVLAALDLPSAPCPS